MNGIIKIVQALEDSNNLLKPNFAILLIFRNVIVLGAGLLGNILAGKGVARAGYENEMDF